MEADGTMSSQTCCICLEEFDVKDVCFKTVKCKHQAHENCVLRLWNTGIYNCPICRTPFSDDVKSDQTLKRYAKMLKSGLQNNAVRQRMIVDGISEDKINSFFTGGASESVHINEDIIATNIAPNFDKYRKLLRVGTEERAVRQIMANDNISNDTVELFLRSVFDA